MVMVQKLSDQEAVLIYQEISQFPSFQEMVAVNADPKNQALLAQYITSSLTKLQTIGIEELIQHRISVYHLKPIESIPVLKILEFNFEIIESLGSLELLQKALLNIIDGAIYQAALEDSTHNNLNLIREHIFTIEDYCLQIEHTIDLRRQCQHEIQDELQIKLIEDHQKMQKYLKQLESITQAVIEELKVEKRTFT